MHRVFIPPAIRALANGQESVEASGTSVLQVICDVERQFPGFKARVCQDDALRPGMTVVVNGAVSALGTLQRLTGDAEIHFLPALGGG